MVHPKELNKTTYKRINP